MFNSTSPWTAVPVYRQVFQTMCSYLAHHLESSVQQFLGSLVINRFWSVVNHGVVAHQFKISLKKKIMTNLALEKYTSGFLFFFHSSSPHLEFCNCVVLIVIYLVFHGAEVHGMLDDGWVTRSNRICYWKGEESMGVFPEGQMTQL